MGLLHQSIDLEDITIAESKIDKEKARLKVTSHQKHVQNYENLICIGVDNRIRTLYNTKRLQRKMVKMKKVKKSKEPESLNFHQRDGYRK